jgi:hypothetical protein
MELILLAVVLVLVLVVIAAYNRLVRSRVRIDEAWAQIDTQLQRRHDLIPNLVESVKGYAAHERGTFEEVTAERQRHGAGHYIRIGDGPYSVTGGWPSVYAMHMGGGFCGMAPTGRPVFMRVMDFYLHHEGLIRENWVLVDLLHVYRQIGVDVLDSMRAFGKARTLAVAIPI